jgi:hypothetical protein
VLTVDSEVQTLQEIAMSCLRNVPIRARGTCITVGFLFVGFEVSLHFTHNIRPLHPLRPIQYDFIIITVENTSVVLAQCWGHLRGTFTFTLSLVERSGKQNKCYVVVAAFFLECSRREYTHN